MSSTSAQHLLHAFRRIACAPTGSAISNGWPRSLATAAQAASEGSVQAQTSAGLGLQGQPEQPSTSGRGQEDDKKSKRSQAGGSKKIVTTAPWPFLDPSRPYIMPTLIPTGKPPPVTLADAVKRVKENAAARCSLESPHQKLSGRPRPLYSFDESVELMLKLEADPRKADQMVRGIALLPHGTGKKVRIAVFAKGPEAEEALKEGVDVLGDEQLIQEIVEKGQEAVQFDRLVATPTLMKPLTRAGRILGPLGLMPNPKVGTLTSDVVKAIRELRAGRFEFRLGRDGQIMTVVGKASFPESKLEENVGALMASVVEARPKGIPGQGTQGYVRSAYLKSSMTPAVAVKPDTCLPAAPEAKGPALEEAGHMEASSSSS